MTDFDQKVKFQVIDFTRVFCALILINRVDRVSIEPFAFDISIDQTLRLTDCNNDIRVFVFAELKYPIDLNERLLASLSDPDAAFTILVELYFKTFERLVLLRFFMMPSENFVTRRQGEFLDLCDTGLF